MQKAKEVVETALKSGGVQETKFFDDSLIAQLKNMKLFSDIECKHEYIENDNIPDGYGISSVFLKDKDVSLDSLGTYYLWLVVHKDSYLTPFPDPKDLRDLIEITKTHGYRYLTNAPDMTSKEHYKMRDESASLSPRYLSGQVWCNARFVIPKIIVLEFKDITLRTILQALSSLECRRFLDNQIELLYGHLASVSFKDIYWVNSSSYAVLKNEYHKYEADIKKEGREDTFFDEVFRNFITEWKKTLTPGDKLKNVPMKFEFTIQDYMDHILRKFQAEVPTDAPIKVSTDSSLNHGHMYKDSARSLGPISAAPTVSDNNSLPAAPAA